MLGLFDQDDTYSFRLLSNETVDEEVNVPLIVFYLAHIAVCLLFLAIVDYCPRFLAMLLFVGLICGYPLSLILQQPVFQYIPGDIQWIASAILAFLVVLFGAIPILWFYWSKLLRSFMFGRLITAVLVISILETLYLDTTNAGVCGYIRACSVFAMCASLLLRLRILEIRSQPSIYKYQIENYCVVLYTPVTTLWTFAFTIWNLSYVLSNYGVKNGIQIVLMWLGIGYEKLKGSLEARGLGVFCSGYKLDSTYVSLTDESKPVHETPNAPPLGWHFGFARALTLGAYFFIDPALGMIPYFNEDILTEPLICSTEIIIYDAATFAVFLVDLAWAIQEYYHINNSDKQLQHSSIQVLEA